MFGKKKKLTEGPAKEDGDPMLINFRIATLIGCWAIKSTVPWKRNTYAVYRFINVGLFAILPVLEVIDIFTVLDDVEKLNYNLCASAGTVMLIFKLLIVLYHREQLEYFQTTLVNYFDLPYIGSSKEDRNIVKKTDDEIRKFLKSFYAMVIFTVTFWSAIPLIDHNDEELVTSVRIWLPVDQSKTPTYQIVCSVEAYMLYMYAGAILTIDLLFFGFVPKFCAHFEIMIKNMESLGKRYEDKEDVKETKEEEERAYRDLKRIVMHHQEVTNMAHKLSDIYRPIILMHFFGMAVLMCVEVFDIVMVPHEALTSRLIMQFGYLSSSILDTFIYCFHGQKLMDKSDDLVMAAYGVPWYNMSLRCKKMLIQIIVKSQNKPLAMKAGGGLFIVDYTAFVSVMKSSYNFLAILEQMQE